MVILISLIVVVRLLFSSCAPVYHEWTGETFETKQLPGVQEKAAAAQIWRDKGPFSQCGQDTFLLNHTHYKKKGYFVDLAANDYHTISNTFYVERDYEWDGICIEPNPEYLPGLLQHRNCKIYVNPVGLVMGETVSFRYSEGMGTITATSNETIYQADKGDVKLLAVTLESILDHAKAPAIIDYLSLDVEGHELYVLKHFNFHKYRFMFITIERPIKHLHHILANHGYWWVYRICDFGDVVYVHKTHPDFASIMDSYRLTANSDWEEHTHPYMREPAYKGF